MKYVSFPLFPVEAALSIFKVMFFVKNCFRRVINKDKVNLNQWRSLSFPKMCVLKISVQ